MAAVKGMGQAIAGVARLSKPGVGLRSGNGGYLSIHDSTLLAVALDTGCDEFLSEDVPRGLVIDERLTVRNPSLAA